MVGKYQRRRPGFDDHVISMYARGMRAAPMVFERPQSGGALTCSRSLPAEADDAWTPVNGRGGACLDRFSSCARQ
ncbi:hypothetical protein WK58_28235 [Burkholderia ubonensis]|nr:hypothetical protein WK58_28235 [Burkholderia ubonensis]